MRASPEDVKWDKRHEFVMSGHLHQNGKLRLIDFARLI